MEIASSSTNGAPSCATCSPNVVLPAPEHPITDTRMPPDRTATRRHEDWCQTARMKKLVEYGIDDHPADDPERVQINWIVAVLDDCDECEDRASR